MRFGLTSIAARLVLATGFLFSTTTAYAAAAENCNAMVDPALKGAELSQKLRRCSSVLKPLKSGDVDIIIPAPVLDDPFAIHPKDFRKGKNGKIPQS